MALDQLPSSPAETAHHEKPATWSLAIPKLREGSFFPRLLERRHRIDQAPTA